MSDNIIYNSNNNTHIGYQKDLADLLLDFNGWADNENLLVLSDNNGMGWTIREYDKNME